MSPPSVSVIVPFFDDERFLAEAVDSVRAQGFGDWELILADDGSTDASTVIAWELAAADPARIRSVAHPGHVNRGSSATRNLGVADATGRYVAFLDADDVWEPGKLDEQVEILQRLPGVDMVVGATTYWHDWSDSSGSEDRWTPVGGRQDAVIAPPELLVGLWPLGRGVAPSASGFMVRRALLDRIGGFEEAFRGFYDDQAFLVKVYLESSVYVSSRTWDRYRQHPASMSHGVSQAEHRRVRRDLLVWFGRYLDARGVDDREVRSALRRAWFPYRYPRSAAIRRRLGIARAKLRRMVGRRATHLR